MSAKWFTKEGASGTLSIEYRNGSWYVSSSLTDDEVKCLFVNGLEIDESIEKQSIDVAISSHKIGVGNNASILMLEPTSQSVESPSEESRSSHSKDIQATTTNKGEQITTDPSQKQQTETDNNESIWKLESFKGSGEYVSVVATIESIHWVKKQKSGMPDIKGGLVDDSVRQPVPFVVREGVKHPYLEKGAIFKFRGVKDHYYSRRDQVQVVVTNSTDYTHFGYNPKYTSSGQASNNRSSSTRQSKKKCNESLQKIASQKIGEKEFTVSKEEEDSIVGRAKKKASDQQRDPAIDPRLRKLEEDDEESS